jgi:hypothetical protein
MSKIPIPRKTKTTVSDEYREKIFSIFPMSNPAIKDETEQTSRVRLSLSKLIKMMTVPVKINATGINT